MKRNRLTVPIVTILLLLPSLVLAQEGDAGLEGIVININPSAAAQRTPIAVPDAMDLSGMDPAGLASTISLTLRRDLNLAGYFQVLGPANLFFDQHADGMSESTINFTNWFNAGASLLAKTGFRVTGNTVQLDFRLFDVNAGSQVDLSSFGYQNASVPFDEVPDHVHEFANAIIYFASGFPGPFGGQVAFVGRGAGGSREIFRMTIGGDGMSQVTDNRTINILPRWAGSDIVYTSYYRGNPDLVIGAGSNARVLSARSGINSGGALSPNGDVMAITLSQDGNSEIYLIDPTSGDIVSRLTNDRGEDVDPVWSPSGDQIAFVSDRSGGPQIYIMNADGSDQRRLTFVGRYNTTPDWSPDGSRVAFTGRDSRNRFDIFTVDVASSVIERLTQDQGDNESPSWSPDGQYLVFSSTRGGGEPRLYIMTQDGNSQELLTREGSGYTMPVWKR
ncbi:MAG: PD40 domain-containing protein [Myxococcales bacterium]|nr:PD40 domain-containing protein [Myxococcales bacterium]